MVLICLLLVLMWKISASTHTSTHNSVDGVSRQRSLVSSCHFSLSLMVLEQNLIVLSNKISQIDQSKFEVENKDSFLLPEVQKQKHS